MAEKRTTNLKPTKASTKRTPKAASKAKTTAIRSTVSASRAKVQEERAQPSETVEILRADLERFSKLHRERFANQQQELKGLRALLEQREHLIALQATAIEDLEAKRNGAEAQRAALSILVQQMTTSLVWRYGALARKFSARLPRFARLFGRFFEGVYQLGSGRYSKRAERQATRKAIMDEDRAAILASDLFEPSWYVARYPDASDYDGGPLEHFLQFGASENRSPNAVFDTAWYKTAYPEVVASGRNPLAYYALFGIAQKHSASPAFDTHWYAVHNAHHLTTGLTPLQHFIHAGQALGLPTQASAAARGFTCQQIGSGVDVPPEPVLPGYQFASDETMKDAVCSDEQTGSPTNPVAGSPLHAVATPMVVKRKAGKATETTKVVHAQQAQIFSRKA